MVQNFFIVTTATFVNAVRLKVWTIVPLVRIISVRLWQGLLSLPLKQAWLLKGLENKKPLFVVREIISINNNVG